MLESPPDPSSEDVEAAQVPFTRLFVSAPLADSAWELLVHATAPDMFIQTTIPFDNACLSLEEDRQSKELFNAEVDDPLCIMLRKHLGEDQTVFSMPTEIVIDDQLPLFRTSLSDSLTAIPRDAVYASSTQQAEDIQPSTTPSCKPSAFDLETGTLFSPTLHPSVFDPARPQFSRSMPGEFSFFSQSRQLNPAAFKAQRIAAEQRFNLLDHSLQLSRDISHFHDFYARTVLKMGLIYVRQKQVVQNAILQNNTSSKPLQSTPSMSGAAVSGSAATGKSVFIPRPISDWLVLSTPSHRKILEDSHIHQFFLTTFRHKTMFGQI
ncbi:hypothetical protein BLNAU_20666 [Blattamonas nauphoetae]|uniref:Uncharacterized protein n=1 Tax=Blattamonas nauphoetae TaxID=2049346 RepID=A0ABQ9X1B3_9EUKA|nr:hypothetical protein BLNAU_20666 [Blattamonas nauphoetae]